MSKVLVVDDEPRYREHISRALSRDGHEVLTAANGRDAVSVGSQFRPDVLVADWMLKNHLHGLHVSEALRVVVPKLETILITGFPASDLREDARSLQVSEFIEKPFEMARLRDAVRAVGTGSPTALDRSPIAVFEVDRRGAVRFPNERARQLLGQTGAEQSEPELWKLLDFTESFLVTDATQRWVTVSPRWSPEARWHLRAKAHADGQGWLVIAIPNDQQRHKDHPVVHMLLDLEPSTLVPWPFEGRTLIVDDDQWVRHVVAKQIECGGGICHTAESAATALETCRRDSGIRVVVVDHDLPGEEVSELVHRLRGVLPGAQIVGTSGSDRSVEFSRLGVTECLLKPWTVSDLTNVLSSRVGNCGYCGLSLPLRRARKGETPARWECVGCGRRFTAVLDKGLPEDVISHVRPVEEE
ncbi:MAG: response regulator [Phycisphaerae bacterium]|nr:response regulator [Phycisphaerae bacterium]